MPLASDVFPGSKDADVEGFVQDAIGDLRKRTGFFEAGAGGGSEGEAPVCHDGVGQLQADAVGAVGPGDVEPGPEIPESELAPPGTLPKEAGHERSRHQKRA